MIADHKYEALSRTNSRIHDILVQMESLNAELKSLQEDEIAISQEISTIEVPDIAPLQERLDNIEAINRQVRHKQEVSRIAGKLEDIERQARIFTDSIACIDQDKKDALEAAHFPVKGLSFDESGVLFNGVPLKQASSAEQIRVSLAIGIAMNPALKFLIIRDGSLLDSKSRTIVADMAAEHDMQVFIEAVDESGSVGFVIEDGGIREPVEPGQQVLA